MPDDQFAGAQSRYDSLSYRGFGGGDLQFKFGL